MSELFCLILPESSSSMSPTISFAKREVLDSDYLHSLIVGLKNMMWIYDIDDFKILYDAKNIKSFLSFFDREGNKELYSPASRLRSLFKEGRFKPLNSNSDNINSLGAITIKGEPQTVWNIFCEIAKIKNQNLAFPIAILHKDVFNAQNGNIFIVHNSANDSIALLPLCNFDSISEWLAVNRTPKRLYEWNPKHGENGKAEHSALKRRGEVSVLRSDRDYPATLVGKAYGQTNYAKHDPKGNLYVYDSKWDSFLRFVPGGSQPNTYHAFHIRIEDVPNEIMNKYAIIHPGLL